MFPKCCPQSETYSNSLFRNNMPVLKKRGNLDHPYSGNSIQRFYTSLSLLSKANVTI